MKSYYSRKIGNVTNLWYIERLWRLANDLPIKTINTKDLDNQLDIVCWFNDKELPNIRAIINHIKQIENVDFDHPIILSSDGFIMDGMHRLAKAVLYGQDKMTVVQFIKDPTPDEILTNHS